MASAGHETGALRVAIIGYGMAGQVFHAPLVASTPGMRVDAIVTSDKARRLQASADYPEATLYDSVDDLWRNAGKYDLVVVGAPNRFHVPLASTALQNGLPVVIDKPLATSSEEGREVLDLAQKRGLLLSCFQNRRWDADFLTVKHIVKEDLLGRVSRFESRFERYRETVRPHAWRESTPWEEGGGLLWDLGSHLIDQAMVLFGPPSSVFAEASNRRQGSVVDDDTFVALSFPNGVHAHLWMSAASRISGPRFRVHGFRGTYEKYGLDPQEAALQAGDRPGGDSWGTEPRDAWGRILTQIDGLTVDGQVETLPGEYQAYYAGIRDTLVDGKPLPVDPRDSVRVMEIIEAAHESARENRTVIV
jgi:scyllo-inositol 2-dehydrogenase (NADP+)